MKRFLMAAALASAFGLLVACQRPAEPAPAEVDTTPPPAAVDAGIPATTAEASGRTPAAMTAAPVPAAPGAPAFAVLYPGGVTEGEAVVATGQAGPGGLVTYTTEADPDAVVAFHRAQAEAQGLSSVMAMNQGDARAYGAAKGEANLQVVASPTEDSRTSVQLSWSAGR